MNKTTVIKKTIGSVIKEYGFEFLRREYKIIWIFNRVINDVEERVIIQQHKEDDSEYKIMLSTSAMGNGRKEIGDIMPEYEGKEYWPAETDKEFEDVMAFFAEFLKDKGMEILDDMLTEKPDSFETPERKAWFKEHRSELVAKYEDRYHILANGSRYEQFIHIDEILYENRASGEDKESVEKVYDLILGMAAILCEIILKEDGAYVSYDTYYVEAYNPVLDRIWTCWPIHIVSQAWIRYHDGEELKRLCVWGRLTSYIRDSTVYMEKGEFVDYVERLMTKEGITPDLYNDEESGADFIIINPNAEY